MTTTATARPEPETCSTTVRRVFAAPRAFVFDAFTRPELLRKWWAPGEMEAGETTFEASVGGRYRFEMREPGGGGHASAGTVTTFEPGQRIGYTFAWEQEDGTLGRETYVVIDFADHAEGTEVVLTHSGFVDQETADQHKWGWSGIFAKFDHTR